MSSDLETIVEEGAPRYLAGGDTDLAGYYPARLDDLGDHATVEGSMLNGAVRGADAFRTIASTLRTVYGDSQEFHFAGPWSANGWVEDYIARIEGRPLGCVVLVTRNDAGPTQNVVASYRPISTVIRFSQLMREKLADTPYARYFLDPDV